MAMSKSLKGQNFCACVSSKETCKQITFAITTISSSTSIHRPVTKAEFRGSVLCAAHKHGKEIEELLAHKWPDSQREFYLHCTTSINCQAPKKSDLGGLI